MGRLAYLVVGGFAGVALSENKELVGEGLIQLAGLIKSLANSSLDTAIQGTKLVDVPILGTILKATANMNIDRNFLQQGVNQASSMSKEAIRHVETAVARRPIATAVGDSKSSSQLIFRGIFLAVPFAYIAYDKTTRRKVVLAWKKLTAGSVDHLPDGLKNSASKVKDFCGVFIKKVQVITQEIRIQAPTVYQQVAKRVEFYVKLIQNHANSGHTADKEGTKASIM